MTLILVAFLLEQRGIWKNDELVYDAANCVGSFLLVVYAVDGGSWPFIILNAVWGLYSLHDVILDIRKQHGRKRMWMIWRR